MKRKIGIIGFGNMGSAISERLKSDYRIVVFDKDKDKTKDVRGMKIARNIKDLVESVDLVILAVKPQDFNTVLNEIALTGKDRLKDKLIVSIAAGISTNYIEKYLREAKVIRCMPNLPVRVGKGMICLCKGRFATQEDLNFTKSIFDNMGETLILNEDMMDKATVISGSGPGYYYDLIQIQKINPNNKNDLVKFEEEFFIPSLVLSAQGIGFTEEEARVLVRNTAEGSRALLELTKFTPGELFKQVASKGGVTISASEILHRGGCIEEAVKAALERAKELSKD